MPKFPIKVYVENQCRTIANAGAFRWLCSAYKYIQAAGGLITNEKGEILMIYRRGKWDFPKGKIEEVEEATTAALREVQEETGLQAEIIEERPISTFHCYDTYGENMIKETIWFVMFASSEQPLIPQTTEDIEKAEWVAEEEVEKLLQDSFPSLKDLWEQYSKR